MTYVALLRGHFVFPNVADLIIYFSVHLVTLAALLSSRLGPLILYPCLDFLILLKKEHKEKEEKK